MYTHFEMVEKQANGLSMYQEVIEKHLTRIEACVLCAVFGFNSLSVKRIALYIYYSYSDYGNKIPNKYDEKKIWI